MQELLSRLSKLRMFMSKYGHKIGQRVQSPGFVSISVAHAHQNQMWPGGDRTRRIRYEGFSSPEGVYSTAGSSRMSLICGRGQKQTCLEQN